MTEEKNPLHHSVAISARLFMICLHLLFLISVLVESISAMAPLVIALAFIVFIGHVDAGKDFEEDC